LAEARPQCLEVNWFLEISSCAKLFAMFLGLSAGLPAYDNYGDHLRAAEGSECLQQFIAGIFRHSQIEQDGIGPVFERESQTLFGLARVNDFIIVAQFKAHQASQRFIIVHN
jgi:hypothetical protein